LDIDNAAHLSGEHKDVLLLLLLLLGRGTAQHPLQTARHTHAASGRRRELHVAVTYIIHIYIFMYPLCYSKLRIWLLLFFIIKKSRQAEKKRDQ
jgi:hypothetical protein